ncbi:MAG: peroxide stress protein YaaA [Burkholderiaceae bacterium]
MLIVLSPAKTLDYTTPSCTEIHTKASFTKRSVELVGLLQGLSAEEIGSIMNISGPLAQLNVQRFSEWSPRVSGKNAKQAVLAFDGDVYDGLKAGAMTSRQLAYLQSHLRILSGLYGVLRPLDLIQPYRLEMGTRLPNSAGQDLYAFWGDSVTAALNEALASKRDRTLVNLASKEYFKVVKPRLLHAQIVSPVFEDWKNGQFRVVSFFAKRARGAMAAFAARHSVSCAESLQSFEEDGYRFDPSVSNQSTWRFRRQRED